MCTFRTKDLALAAFLRTRGYDSRVGAPDDPSGYCDFLFEGDPSLVGTLAKEFSEGASVRALEYWQSLNALKAQIRYARGGWR